MVSLARRIKFDAKKFPSEFGRWMLVDYAFIVNNRPLAARGHVTNGSFKQWLEMLLMPKIVKAHKNYLTRNLRGNTCKGNILWHKVVSFVLAAMLEYILLPSNMAAKTTFCLYLDKRWMVTLRCAENVTTSSFNNFLEVQVQNCCSERGNSQF